MLCISSFPLHIPPPWHGSCLFEIIQRTDDASFSLRVEAIRTLGILGALDPAKYHLLLLQQRDHADMVKSSDSDVATRGEEEGESETLTHLLPLQDYYCRVTIKALLRILR